MSNVLKTASLDFALLKPYIKSIIFVIIVPIIFTFMSLSLISGVSFAMCVMSMASSYTFAVSEKNGMERLYGILPVTKKHLVFGKYICVCSMGFLALMVSLILQSMVLLALSVPVSFNEILYSGIAGVTMFIFYIVFQVPGYYKYGSIKGRMFMYVPVVGFLLIYMLFNYSIGNATTSPMIIFFAENPVIIIPLAILLIIAMLAISVVVSIKILQNKEF